MQLQEHEHEHEHEQIVQRLIRPQVANLPIYDPGADPTVVARQYGLSRVVKLSNNENPLGMSPFALRAVERCLEQEPGRYPDPAGRELCNELARRHDLAPERIILGNGSENILELLCQALLNPGDTVVTQAPCFGLHEIFPAMMGAEVIKVALTPQFDCDVSAWTLALGRRAKLVFISNPSNPVGVVFTQEQLERIFSACPEDCLLVLDEAYFEYAIGSPEYPDALQLLRDQQRPWIVLRTFSKAYGLASLRVGYGLASHPSLIEALHRVRTPYNVNQLAQRAALAALEDRDHLKRSVALMARERQRLTSALRDTGYRVAPSLANFLFIDTAGDAAAVSQGLLRQGVIVKAWREPGYRQFIRMSLALPADNDLFLQALHRLHPE
ncbi:histidinol-phosphate transaminase [Pseudomonas sp. CrR25]|nr:histidinol-phosphate transaminase [Pseudomonas sp. CrR25]